MVPAVRWALRSLALTGVALVSLGILLLVTWAYPDIRCSGDFCLIGQNSLAIPAIVIGAVLEFVALAALWSRRTEPRAAKN